VFLPKNREQPAPGALGRRFALLCGLTTQSDKAGQATAAKLSASPAASQAATAPAPPQTRATPIGRARVNSAAHVDRRNADRDTGSTSIAVSCRVAALVDDTTGAVLLSQLIYWSRRGRDMVEREGWVYKTAREWEMETGLTWKMQRRARRILLDLG
jgi:hypothetical protein